jgi:hypothetical protein
MNRLLVLTLAASFASSSVAFAGEGLAQSASRVVEQTATQATTTLAVGSHTPMIATQASKLLNRVDVSKEAALAQEQPVVSKSGMSKSKKMLIYAAIGVGFAASAYAIDRHDLNLTPSTLGTRKD